MNSWAICTPRSFLASSSRSTNWIWRPSTPPLLLISSVARRTPSRMLTPMEDEPPVKGPSTPILIGSAANAPAQKATAPATARSLNRNSIEIVSRRGREKSSPTNIPLHARFGQSDNPEIVIGNLLHLLPDSASTRLAGQLLAPVLALPGEHPAGVFGRQPADLVELRQLGRAQRHLGRRQVVGQRLNPARRPAACAGSRPAGRTSRRGIQPAA